MVKYIMLSYCFYFIFILYYILYNPKRYVNGETYYVILLFIINCVISTCKIIDNTVTGYTSMNKIRILRDGH